MVERKAGRPTLGNKKLTQRAITSDPEIEEFLRKNPSVNASEVFRRAVRSMMPKDVDTIRLNKLSVEISEMRVTLSIKEAEYQSLKRRVEEREKIHLDLRLERDCHSWYLRSLIQAGVFRVIGRGPETALQIIQREIDEGSIKRFEFEISGEWVCLTGKASSATRRRLKNCLKGDIIMPIPAMSWVVPDLDRLRSQYGISINFEDFQEAFLENQSMGDLPLEYFARFKPAIIQDRIKSEVKGRMEPEYRKFTVETGVNVG